jgi:ADP-sugar diphosphatase
MDATVHPSARAPSLTLRNYNGRNLDPEIPVYLPPALTAPEFLALFSSPERPTPAYTFPALQNWFVRTLANFALQHDQAHPFHKHPYKLREIDVQTVDWFWRNRTGHEDKLGFMKVQTKVETDAYVHAGEEKPRADWIPGAIFLRGGSVAVLVSLLQNVCRAELSWIDHHPARGRRRR